MQVEFTLSPLPNLTGAKPPQAALTESCHVIALTGGKWKVTMLPVREGKQDRPSAYAKFDPKTGKEAWYCYFRYGKFNPEQPSKVPLQSVGSNVDCDTAAEAMARFPQGIEITVPEPEWGRPAQAMIFAIPTDFYNKKGSMRIALEPVI
ncbi:MAG: hypothetical protein ACK40C_05745 [Novosphingobium meiothermophilum]